MKKLRIHVKMVAYFFLVVMFLVLPMKVNAQEVSVSNLSDLTKVIYERMYNWETNFQIRYLGDTNELVANISNVIQEAYSQDDYIRWSWTNISPSMKGKPNDIVITMKIDYMTTISEEAYINQRVQEILSNIITPNMSEKAKVEAIHNWVISNVSYDYSLISRSAYTALVNGQTVCQGYSLLMEKMLESVGIETRILDGYTNSGYHAWNLVKVNGYWYHIDSTNDSILSNKTKYYMVTDEYLKECGYTWDYDKYPSAITIYSKDEEVEVGLTQEQLNIIAKAELYLNFAVKNKNIYYVTLAYNEIAKLPNCVERTSLELSANTIKATVEAYMEEDRIQRALNAITTLEASPSKAKVLVADAHVKLVSTLSLKETLTNRIRIAEETLNKGAITQTPSPSPTQIPDPTPIIPEPTPTPAGPTSTPEEVKPNTDVAIKKATTDVANAEKFKTEFYITKAQNSINNLNNSAEKYELLTRLSKFVSGLEQANINEALNYVERAEIYMTSVHKKVAQTAINKLTDNTVKDALQERLNLIK